MQKRETRVKKMVLFFVFRKLYVLSNVFCFLIIIRTCILFIDLIVQRHAPDIDEHKRFEIEILWKACQRSLRRVHCYLIGKQVLQKNMAN